MSKVALIDPNFKVIFDYLSNPQSDITILTLSQSLQDLRKQINLNWYSKFLQYDHISYLAEIWEALFQLLADSISDDPGLRISIFKTLGALIFALSPFIPFTTVASFLSAIQNKPSNPHLSIAIISCFCHISQFVSPLNFDSFISKSPIVQYFSDLKQSPKQDHHPQSQTFYDKYLPKIISNVKPLNLEFQRFLLSSLLNTFGENPTLPFIFAIINLLKNAIDPTVLLDDMIQYINQRKEQRQLTLLMISPYLLEKEKENKTNEIEENNFSQITNYLNEKVKEELFDLAISTIRKNAPNVPSFSEFEQACRTLSALLEKEKSASKLNEQISKIKDALNLIECPSYLKICTFPFIDSIDELTPKEEDKLSIITAKLSALSNFLKRFPTIENFRKIFKIFISFLNIESKEVLTNLINAVLKCFSVITVDSITEKVNSEKVDEIQRNLKILLENFLNISTSNFVQNVAIANLIQSVDVDVGSLLIPNYKKISFHIIFNFCFSMHNNLSETAINVLKSIIQYKTVSNFISLLFNEIDFFDSFSLFKICEISNVLINTIGYQTVNEFKCLIEPILESLTLIHRSSTEFTKIIRTEAEVFCFLNKMQEGLNCESDFLNDKQINELKLICFDLISRIFESFTGIDPQLPTISPPIQPITSLIETDISLKSFDDQTYFLKAIQECMIFINCIQNKNQKEFSNEKFTELLIRLVKILPEETLNILKSLKSSFFMNSDSYLVLLLDIMKTTNSVLVASQCALASSNSDLMEQQIKIFIQSQPQFQPQNLQKIKMFKLIMKFVNKKLIKNGRCKYNFLQYIKKVQQIYNDFQLKQTTENEKNDGIEKVQIIPEIELDSKSENVLFSFLESEDKISFIKSVCFHDWPINDKEFFLFISKNQGKLTPIELNLFEKNFQLTNKEIKFIAQNWKMFDKEVINNIKEKYNDLFNKLFNEEAENYLNDGIQKPEFNFKFIVKKIESKEEIQINDQIVSSSSSIFNNLTELQSNLPLSIPLIKNFFIFQEKFSSKNFVFSEELFNQILSLLIENELTNRNSFYLFDFKLVINYAIEHKIKIEFELIKKMIEKELIEYSYEFSIYLSIISIDSKDDDKSYIDQLKSFLLSVISNKFNEKDKNLFTHHLYELLMNKVDAIIDKNIVLNITKLTAIWPSCFCSCFDYDYYNYISKNLNKKRKIFDSNFVLSSFEYFKELKSTQSPSFFKSVELLRNSNYFISQYFQYIFQLNKIFNYKNEKINKEFVLFLNNFSKFLFEKAEFLVNSNFNLFITSHENRSNFFYFFRMIELFLYSIHSILITIQNDEFEKEIFNSISKFVRSLIDFFQSMFDSDCLSYIVVHREIGRILFLTVLISNLNSLKIKQSKSNSQKRITINEGQIVDLINKITQKSGIFSYSSFLESSSLLLLTSSSSSLMTNILKNNNGSIIQICKYGNLNTFVKIPSDCLSVLRSLMILIHPSLLKILISNFSYIFYPSIVDVFRIFGGMKIALIDIMIEKVVRRLLSNQEFNAIQNLVLPYLEKYAKEEIEKQKKLQNVNFGVADRIMNIIDSVKIK